MVVDENVDRLARDSPAWFTHPRADFLTNSHSDDDDDDQTAIL